MKQTTSHAGTWTEWPDFDEEGDTGRTIIVDAEGRAILCTCEATEAEKNLAKATPRLKTTAPRLCMRNVSAKCRCGGFGGVFSLKWIG